MKRSVAMAGLEKLAPVVIDLTKTTRKKAKLPVQPPPRQKEQEKPKVRLVLQPEQPLQCYVPEDVWNLIVDLIDVRDAGAVLSVMQLNTQMALRITLRLKRWLMELFECPAEGVAWVPEPPVLGDIRQNTRQAMQRVAKYYYDYANKMESLRDVCYTAVLAASPQSRDCIVPLSNVTYLVHMSVLDQQLRYKHSRGLNGMYYKQRCEKRWMVGRDRIGNLFYRPRQADGTGAKNLFLCVRRLPRLATVKMPRGTAAENHCRAHCDTMDDREKGYFYKELLDSNNDETVQMPLMYAILRHTLVLHSAHADSRVRDTVQRRTEQDTQYTHLLLGSGDNHSYYVCIGHQSEKEKQRILQYDRFMRKFARAALAGLAAILLPYAAAALKTTNDVLKLK